MKLSIADIELFESLLDFELNGNYIDLHNDSLCIKIEYRKDENFLILIFYNHAHSCYVELRFEYVQFPEQIIPDFEIGKVGIRLDNMYKGRFELDERLYELTDSFCGYMYIDFLDSLSLEFYAKNLSIELL